MENIEINPEHLEAFSTLSSDPQRDTYYTAWRKRWVIWRSSMVALHGYRYWDALSNAYVMGYCQQEDAIQD